MIKKTIFPKATTIVFYLEFILLCFCPPLFSSWKFAIVNFEALSLSTESILLFLQLSITIAIIYSDKITETDFIFFPLMFLINTLLLIASCEYGNSFHVNITKVLAILINGIIVLHYFITKQKNISIRIFTLFYILSLIFILFNVLFSKVLINISENIGNYYLPFLQMIFNKIPILGYLVFAIITIALIIQYYRNIDKTIVFILIPLHILFLFFIFNSDIIGSLYQVRYDRFYSAPRVWDPKLNYGNLLFKICCFALLFISITCIKKLFSKSTMAQNTKLIFVCNIFLILLSYNRLGVSIIAFIVLLISNIISKRSKPVYVYIHLIISLLFLIYLAIIKIPRRNTIFPEGFDLYPSALNTFLESMPFVIPYLFFILIIYFIACHYQKLRQWKEENK